jgi:valyl-tRNA synthetase
VLEIIDDHGKLNEKAQILVGEDRFVARKKIVKMLEESGNLLKVEDYTSPVGYSERTDAVIEPKLSAQWFLKMESLAATALETVLSGRTNFIPEKYINTYRHWMENARDWCISRQLWWGQRIPAYYLPDGKFVVAATAEEALQEARAINPNIKAEDLKQDEDVLDTWFSSWLWPISVFDPEKPGHPDHQPNKDLAYYYPTNDLVTGPDIIFFWVARMIMAGEEFMGKEPFSNVYFTGIVRDKIGRKMSKTLGNSPNPLDLIDTYGADAVRIGMLLCSSAGNDIFYDEAQIKQGAAFCNKIWNSYRLVKGFQVDAAVAQSPAAKLAIEWFAAKLSDTLALVEDHYSKFRISDALMTIYKLFWDDYCSWYLEAIKPAFGQPVDPETYNKTLEYFEALLKLIHPVMPFITEELWQDLAERKEGETIMYAPTPKAEAFDPAVLENFSLAAEAVNGVRSVRNQKNIAPKEQLHLLIRGSSFPCIPVIEKMAGVNVELVGEFGDAQGVGFMVRTQEMFVKMDGLVNVAEEIEKAQKELEYQQKFLQGVRAKLANENFVAHAPAAVIENERKKEADSLSKIESLEAKLKSLKK